MLVAVTVDILFSQLFPYGKLKNADEDYTQRQQSVNLFQMQPHPL